MSAATAFRRPPISLLPKAIKAAPSASPPSPPPLPLCPSAAKSNVPPTSKHPPRPSHSSRSISEIFLPSSPPQNPPSGFRVLIRFTHPPGSFGRLSHFVRLRGQPSRNRPPHTRSLFPPLSPFSATPSGSTPRPHPAPIGIAPIPTPLRQDRSTLSQGKMHARLAQPQRISMMNIPT
jgi:hypothetical protein